MYKKRVEKEQHYTRWKCKEDSAQVRLSTILNAQKYGLF